MALAHLLHAHMAGGNRYALAVEASGALRASLVVRPGDEDVRGGQERAGETQHFLALAAAAHDRQVRLLPGQYADLLGKPPLRGVTWKCRPVRREIMSSRSEAMPEKVSSELKKASGAGRR